MAQQEHLKEVVKLQQIFNQQMQIHLTGLQEVDILFFLNLETLLQEKLFLVKYLILVTKLIHH
jgi:hypothetical protein